MEKLINHTVMFFCRLGWAGLSPKAPGTIGSIVALIMAPWLFVPLQPVVQIVLLSALFVLGGVAATHAEKICMCKDPSQVVVDELLGQWVALMPITMLLYTPGMSGFDLTVLAWPWLLLGFVLFRAFDILKPWPIKASENWLPGGYGIMLDDLIAGLFAAFLLYSVIYKFG